MGVREQTLRDGTLHEASVIVTASLASSFEVDLDDRSADVSAIARDLTFDDIRECVTELRSGLVAPPPTVRARASGQIEFSEEDGDASAIAGDLSLEDLRECVTEFRSRHGGKNEFTEEHGDASALAGDLSLEDIRECVADVTRLRGSDASNVSASRIISTICE